MLRNGEFLEFATVFDNYYGTPIFAVDEKRRQGKDVVLEIEVQGALIVKQKRPEAKLVFIIPPSFSDLELRLRSRGTETEETIAKRLEKAREEYQMADQYDYIVLNDKVEKAADELRAIILASRCAVGRRINLLR